MDSSASRFVAALLSRIPGSEVVENLPGRTTVSLALVPIKQVVVVVEASEHRVQFSEHLKQALSAAKRGVPLHLVVINPRAIEVDDVLKEHISFLQMKVVTGWNWVPGSDPVAVRGPSAPQIVQAAKLANSTASLSLDELTTVSHREADVVRAFQLEVMQRRPLVSWTLAVVCVVVFALQMYWGDSQPVMAASRMGALIPTKVMAGDWWRLFSVMLLHANFVHLLMNMLAMLSFGPFLERLMGSGRYLVLFVISGLGGSLLSMTRGGDMIGVGASGGIWGLMLAGAVVVSWPRGLLPVSLSTQLRQRAWTPVAINLFYSLQPGIDMLAHVGGGIVGGLLVLGLTRGAVPNEPLKPSRLSNLAAVAVGLLLAASMGIALISGKPWQLTGPWQLKPVTIEGTKLTLSVPEGMELEHEAKSLVWSFGDLNSTGAQLILELTEPLAEEVDVSSPLEDLLAEDLEPFAGLHYSQKPRLVKFASGRQAVFAEQVPDDKDDVRFLRQWWLFEQRRWVMLTVNALNSTSPGRKAQFEEIADSVHLQP